MTQNQSGLSRNIPSAIKRQIRQEAGYGCVICGFAVYHYEHIDPFVKVDQHDPENMTILCGRCHDQVTRRQIDKDFVKSAKLNPKCKEQGFAQHKMFLGRKLPEVKIGNFVFEDTKYPLVFEDEPVVWINEPENEEAPIGLNVQIRLPGGKLAYQIENNEVRISKDNWDVEVSGQDFTIRSGKGSIFSKIKINTSKSFELSRFHTSSKSCSLDIEGLQLKINSRDTNVISTGGRFSNYVYGLLISKESIRFASGGRNYPSKPNEMNVDSIHVNPDGLSRYPSSPETSWEKAIDWEKVTGLGGKRK